MKPSSWGCSGSLTDLHGQGVLKPESGEGHQVTSFKDKGMVEGMVEDIFPRMAGSL